MNIIDYTPIQNLYEVARDVAAVLPPDSRLAVAVREVEEDAAVNEMFSTQVEIARGTYNHRDDVRVDDCPLISSSEDGCWISAWVWVPHDEDEES